MGKKKGKRGDQKETILIVEDDLTLLETLEYNLSAEGYGVITAADGRTALEVAREEHPDLILLDLMLPGLDGFEVCRILRQEMSVPILMLTARTDEVDFVVGLDAGADDYVGKPFRLAELMARVRALLRRRGGGEPEDVVEVSGIRLERAARRVLVDGSEVTLANKEYELLRVLLEHAGQVVSRDAILQEVWGDADLRGSKTLDMHMSWLRRKIGDEGPAGERRIATVRGVGFRLNTD